jgi:hypothetical protein
LLVRSRHCSRLHCSATHCSRLHCSRLHYSRCARAGRASPALRIHTHGGACMQRPAYGMLHTYCPRLLPEPLLLAAVGTLLGGARSRVCGNSCTPVPPEAPKPASHTSTGGSRDTKSGHNHIYITVCSDPKPKTENRKSKTLLESQNLVVQKSCHPFPARSCVCSACAFITAARQRGPLGERRAR